MSPLRTLLWVSWAASLLCLGLGCDGSPAAHAEAEASRKPQVAPRTALRVRVQLAAEGSAVGLAEATGMTSAFRTATVAAEVSGRVTARHVEPGQVVEAGDALLELDSEQLRIAVQEARADLAARRADQSDASSQLERGDALLEKDAMSARQHDSLGFGEQRASASVSLAEARLRRARRSLSDAVIRAPFDGTVEEVAVQIGDFLAPGTPVSTLADFSKVRVRAGVTAGEADSLSPGLIARLHIPVLGGEKHEVEVRSVGKLADPQTGTYPVELWLENPQGRLRAGMVAKLHFPAPEGEKTGPQVPRGALVRRDGKLVVFVIEGSGEEQRAVSRPVEVGRKAGDQVEILSGVLVGDRVVVEGLFALRDGAAVIVDGDAA
ncbi:MAG: efflux RND transporter periplasmic adaptor subunit [bacterium]|nr:efflux RND transporter periplasmic adaptor subunit [bacterium]MCP5067009.1 efflux RND transporter periplasmic adaptor subunit [bacterium]